MVTINRTYMCIDLKSFYASVECRERGLDPLRTNLVVADEERTDKTVCLAVTPSLKQYGIAGRARLFEVRQKVHEINFERRIKNNYNEFDGKSTDDIELKKDKTKELDFIIAKPRMAYYMEYSSQIYNIYLKYISEKDIFVYSIDEIFCDVTNYLKFYNKTAEELATYIIKDIYVTTGITATAGIGTNLFLAKVAMDVIAKKKKANEFGVRIASLDEMEYRREMWNHTPITDVWRVGKGIAKRLEKYKIYTMGDIARCSITNEDLLYKLLGVNAELLIDHAWGYEPCTIEDVKNYKPETKCLCSGQVLHEPYTFQKARIIIKEMADALALDLVNKNYVTKQLTLTLEYDISNLTDKEICNLYHGEITIDKYGRNVPKHSHGTINLDNYSSSSNIIRKNVELLYERIANPILLIRKIYIEANNLKNSNIKKESNHQLNLFTDIIKEEKVKKNNNKKKINRNEEDDKKIQQVMLKIKNKYGKNSILRGINFEEGATGRNRNKEIGGHSE